jgi:hypothetical protein
MWGLIKGIAGSIFGGGQNAEKKLEMADGALKGIGTWIDERKYTDEEKAKDIGLAVSNHLELVKATMDENGTRSITRRVLAWAITGAALFWASVAMGLAVSTRWTDTTEDAATVTTINLMVSVAKEFWIGESFLAVVIFYFGVQFLRARNK